MDISSPVELAEIAAAPHRLLGVTIAVEGEGPEPAPKCPRNPARLVRPRQPDRERGQLRRKSGRHPGELEQVDGEIVIGDDGRGFPPNILARVGEPYLSQRDGARRNEEAGGGLGLGLFIARSLLERSGATLELANAAAPASGAVATVQWPRSAYERGRRAARLAW